MKAKRFATVLAFSVMLALSGCGTSGVGGADNLMEGGASSSDMSWDRSGVSADDVKTTGDIERADSVWVGNADMSLSAEDFDKASGEMSRLVKDYGCRIMSDSTRTRGMSFSKNTWYEVSDGGAGDVSYHVRNIDIEVPSDKFSAFQEDIESNELMKVEEMSIYGYEMGDAYQDQEARLKGLESKRDWYAKRLEGLDDEQLMLKYFSEMSDLQDQIDSIKSQMESEKHDADWVSASIYLFEDVDFKSFSRAGAAWSETGKALSQLPGDVAYVFGKVAYFVVILLPYALIIAAVVFAIRSLDKRFGRSREQRRAERMARRGSVEDAPAEDAPAEDAPAEDAPAEDAVVSDDSEDDAAVVLDDVTSIVESEAIENSDYVDNLL